MISRRNFISALAGLAIGLPFIRRTNAQQAFTVVALPMPLVGRANIDSGVMHAVFLDRDGGESPSFTYTLHDMHGTLLASKVSTATPSIFAKVKTSPATRGFATMDHDGKWMLWMANEVMRTVE